MDLHTSPWSFAFPRDHHSHSEFRTEWWYFSGNLKSSRSEEWGYQFTIFRHKPVLKIGRAFSMEIPWNGYSGHLSITKSEQRTFRFFERKGSRIFGTAGSGTDYALAWVGGWSARSRQDVITLHAQQSSCGINLRLEPRKPPVLNGTDGFCRKAFNPPGSSFHYSVTSIGTEGTILWDGEMHHVMGSSWMDREFGTQIFPECVQGWDWFGLRLDNGFELMITFLRFTDSEHPSTSYGSVVFPDGYTKRLSGDDFSMTASLLWTSPATGANYPMEWALKVPSHDMELRVNPLVKNHEINSRPFWRIDYWEGPVEILGSMVGQGVTGRGYVELTGYAQALGGKF